MMNSPFLSFKKNDVVRGICEDYTAQGFGVVKIEGFTLFVKGMIKGEEADIRILSLKKTYGYGKLEYFHKASDKRIQERCSIAKVCGGCQLQHMNYEEQLSFKQQLIHSLFERNQIDTDILPIIGMEDPWRYRNKVQVPFGVDTEGNLIYGFYRSHSNDIVPFDDCVVQTELSNQLVKEIQKQLKASEDAQLLRHVLIKHMRSTDEVMIVLIVRKYFDALDELVENITGRYPNIRSIIMNINNRQDNVILGDEEYLLYGSEYVRDHLNGKKFLLSSKSFYQINSIQTEKLYSKALEYANIQKEDTVLDLYGGIGTIGILASDEAKKVITVEYVKEAIADGKNNAQLNHLHNISFFQGDVKDFVAEYNDLVNVVIVDPPRKGLDEDTIGSLLNMEPRAIVYVSCDPKTLVRDLKLLEEKYKVEKVQPVDMFPHTVHVETCVLLSELK